ncbi:universal stress protein [Fulvivirga lutimaris]|uniref:universal stress protein n=1 Tax=Fulvivirga lutimaris TaxID=1819566 RepID=UPI0012BB9905|nr:universal stress protein [Fulvivirga lutimaris]MTI38923.1 universal stress protein [Fulvivirga lutimaris]
MKVLIPTDLTGNSEATVAMALDITAHLSESITFLHLMNLPEYFMQLTHSERKNQHPEVNIDFIEATNRLEKLVEESSMRGVKADYFIGSVRDKDDIAGLANDKFYNLIIMNSLFVDGNKNRPSGYWMKEVIRHTSVPVLAVKTAVRKEINNVALLSDFNNEYLTNKDWINDFVIKMDAKLHLCCINTPSMFFDYRTMKGRMENFKKAFDFETTEVIYNDYQFDTGVKHLSEDLNLDMIIMNTHGRKGMDHFGRGGITEQIVERLDIPILCLPLLGEPKHQLA